MQIVSVFGNSTRYCYLVGTWWWWWWWWWWRRVSCTVWSGCGRGLRWRGKGLKACCVTHRLMWRAHSAVDGPYSREDTPLFIIQRMVVCLGWIKRIWVLYSVHCLQCVDMHGCLVLGQYTSHCVCAVVYTHCVSGVVGSDFDQSNIMCRRAIRLKHSATI